MMTYGQVRHTLFLVFSIFSFNQNVLDDVRYGTRSWPIDLDRQFEMARIIQFTIYISHLFLEIIRKISLVLHARRLCETNP